MLRFSLVPAFDYLVIWQISLESALPFQFFANVEEAEWAVEVMKSTGKPVAITMQIGPKGDMQNVPSGECAVRLARAGMA